MIMGAMAQPSAKVKGGKRERKGRYKRGKWKGRGAKGKDKDTLATDYKNAADTAALIEQQQEFTEGLAEGFWYE